MKNIFVGNLSFGTTEQDLRGLFEAYGTVDRVNIVTDRDSGQPRGFAFVEMSNDAEAQEAIKQLNGQTLGDRQIVVNEARPSAKREGGGGGGRRCAAHAAVGGRRCAPAAREGDRRRDEEGGSEGGQFEFHGVLPTECRR